MAMLSWYSGRPESIVRADFAVESHCNHLFSVLTPVLCNNSFPLIFKYESILTVEFALHEAICGSPDALSGFVAHMTQDISIAVPVVRCISRVTFKSLIDYCKQDTTYFDDFEMAEQTNGNGLAIRMDPSTVVRLVCRIYGLVV